MRATAAAVGLGAACHGAWGGARTWQATAAAVGPGGVGGIDWVGVYSGKNGKNRSQSPNVLNKAPTEADY